MGNEDLSKEKGGFIQALPKWAPLLLGTLTAVGPVSTDIYLPALPEMERDLHSYAGSGSLTMTAWVIGLAIGQICAGPISDRFGRKIPLIWGTIFYTLASIGCALSQTITMLCICRVLAALVGAASLVIPNAIIRDKTKGKASVKLMSRLDMIQGTVPILAPALGGFALQWISWRDIFWVTAIYGFICTFLVFFFLPETLPANKHQPIRFITVIKRYITILPESYFYPNSLIWMFQGFGFFTYLSTAPYFFEHVFGFTSFQYGLLFGGTAVLLISMSQVNAILIEHFNSQKISKYALLVSLLGGGLLFVFAIISFEQVILIHHHCSMIKALHFLQNGQSGLDKIWCVPFIISLLLTLVPWGAVGPNAMTAALFKQGHNAATATALAGTGQYLFGAISSTLCAILPVGTAFPMALFFLIAIFSMMICLKKAPEVPE